MDCVVYNKIKMLFNKILEPDYIMDNYYADGMINKLGDCSNPEISFLKSVPLISDLLMKAWDQIDTRHITVRVFLTRLLGSASQNELHFSKMFSKLSDNVAQSFKEINSPNMNPSLRVALMEVALSIASHNSGIIWLFETGVWKEILSLSSHKQTVFVTRKTYEFTSKMFWRLNDWNNDGKADMKLALDFILNPLYQFDLIRIESISSEDVDMYSKAIEPMLQMLLAILSEYNRINKPNNIVKMMFEDYMLYARLCITCDRMRKNYNISILIGKLTFLLTLAKIFMSKPAVEDVVHTLDDFMDLIALYFNTVNELIRRRCGTLLLDYCYGCNVIWSGIWHKKKNSLYQAGSQTIKLQNQLLFICLVPCLVYVMKPIAKATDERMNEYIFKLLNLTCQHTTKACYAFRDLIMELDSVSITLQSVKRLICLKEHFDNEQANLVFQAMFYMLKEFDPMDDSGEIKQEVDYGESQEKILIITYALDIVQDLVKKHAITWHESLEVICLYNLVFNILKRPNLTCKFIVLALNVVALTVKKFLPPNLSLLLESKPGSAMHELGKLIYMKMCDMNWEVRDSALELLLAVTEISYIKFPPFQNQIYENKLINVAVTLAMNDHEFYVQVSALKCVGAATKISVLWEQLKAEYPNIVDILISILRNNQEGLVRKEACNVLYEVIQNVKLTPDIKERLYEHMVSAALGDFHWEVQLNALKFWKVVICCHLQHQGMLDGTFPPVTFSRETRKIVNLTETEIQKRLIRTLEELSSIGCLAVLIKLLNEDSEVEIMEAALSTSMELIDILVRYKVPDCLRTNSLGAESVDELVCKIKDDTDDYGSYEVEMEEQNEQKSDKVIESILNADDINLLANIYDRHMKLDNSRSAMSIKPRLKLLKCASPRLFLTYLTSQDFKVVIEQKKAWKIGLRSFQSLLEDVIGVYEVNREVNALDCY